MGVAGPPIMVPKFAPTKLPTVLLAPVPVTTASGTVAAGYVLGPGDHLNVSILAQPEVAERPFGQDLLNFNDVLIRWDGMVDLPLVGPLAEPPVMVRPLRVTFFTVFATSSTREVLLPLTVTLRSLGPAMVML